MAIGKLRTFRKAGDRVFIGPHILTILSTGIRGRVLVRHQGEEFTAGDGYRFTLSPNIRVIVKARKRVMLEIQAPKEVPIKWEIAENEMNSFK